MQNTAEKTVIAVERAIHELRAGRAVWVEDILIAAAEITGGTAAQHVPAEVITLLKLAQLLPFAEVVMPAQVGIQSQQPEIPAFAGVMAEEINGYQEALAETLVEVSAAHLPTKYSEDSRIKIFRPRAGMVEHLAVIFGQPETVEAPLVRVHSSCLTGDLLGSLRCDCGDQLQLALEALAKEGTGILCYLNQEGRGIGLGNKIRAYALQEAGQDTLQANESLGFDGDERHFAVAAAMLKKLGVKQIRLLTNNPKKLEDLDRFGVKVRSREPLVAVVHAHNQDYLDTKAKRFGHLL